MQNILKFGLAAFVALFLSSTASAFTLPGASSGGAVDVDDLVGQGNGIVERYQSAVTNLLKAQELLSVALGIKNAGDRSAATAELLAGGVVDKETLEKATAVTEENNKLIAEKIAEGGTLDGSSKAKYGEALPYYSKGTLNGALLVKDSTDYVSSISSSSSQLTSDPLALIKLKDGAAAGVFVGTKLPGLISEWYDNTKTLITFGQKNDIDVSKATEVMQEIKL